MQKNVMVLGE